jgi:diacylglycerol O-acyltransferase
MVRHRAKRVPPTFEPLAREDLAILRLESATVAGHTLKIAILEPPAAGRQPDVEALRARIAERIDRAPRLRRRLCMGAGGRGAGWVDDPSFDLREHVRAVPLPAPLSQHDLRRVCARLMEERLDRTRPLWRIDLLAPLQAGGVAVVWSLHHSMADGATAIRLARDVLWDSPTHPEYQNAHERSSLRASLRDWLVARRPGRLPGTLQRQLSRTHTPSPFDGAIGSSREVAFASMPLGALKRAAKALLPEATVNDAVLALVAGGLRHWMEIRGDPFENVRVKVPVSLHQRAESAPAANRDSFFCVGLPLAEADPAERLRRINEETTLRKQGLDPLVLDTLLHDLGRVAPPLGHGLERLTLHPHAFALNVSNIVGPAERPSVLGAAVQAFYSVAEINERHALRVAVVSMAEKLHFGLCADPAIIGELDPLVTGIEVEAAALADRARAPGPAPRRVIGPR